MSILRSITLMNGSINKLSNKNEINENFNDHLDLQSLNNISRWDPKNSIIFVKQGGKDRIAA